MSISSIVIASIICLFLARLIVLKMDCMEGKPMPTAMHIIFTAAIASCLYLVVAVVSFQENCLERDRVVRYTYKNQFPRHLAVSPGETIDCSVTLSNVKVSVFSTTELKIITTDYHYINEWVFFGVPKTKYYTSTYNKEVEDAKKEVLQKK